MASGAFRDRPWGSRFSELGDEAEGVFDSVLPLGPADRYGLRRPAIDIRKLDPFVRYTPDRVTQAGPLVEVVGLGRDDLLKTKTSKLEALSAWNRDVTLYMFIWHKHRQEWALLGFPPFRSLARRIEKRDGTQHFERDQNEYIAMPWKEITLTRGIVRGEYRAA